MTIQVILYSTSHCHLCELALSLLMSFGEEVTLEVIDIAEDERLLNAYSLLIPVLRRQDTEAELNWPFKTTDISKFLS